jgi:type VI secretion system secreted protein VgrG
MAGGSRIVISDDGITISTGGKIIYKAGQHNFEGGQKVVSPKTALPMFETPYSNKIDYTWDSNLKNKKEIFVLDENKNSLIKSKVDHLDHENNLSSLRFYTLQSTEFIALGFNSSYVSVEQKRLDGENRDELLEEALFEEDDDVSTGDDF